MRRPLILLLSFVLLAAGCGDDDSLRMEGAWARTSPRMADAGAVYLQLTSSSADRLVDAAVDSSVARMVEIHETVMAEMGEGEMGEGEMGEGEMGEGMGAMMMQEVGSIDLPAGETISLEPGGLHIMLMGLTSPLETGQTFELTLTFEEAGERTVEVEVDAP